MAAPAASVNMRSPADHSDPGIHMYIKPSSRIQYEPAKPSRKSHYAASIKLPRSESFESLLELSVLASDLLEGGYTDLERDGELLRVFK